MMRFECATALCLIFMGACVAATTTSVHVLVPSASASPPFFTPGISRNIATPLLTMSEAVAKTNKTNSTAIYIVTTLHNNASTVHPNSSTAHPNSSTVHPNSSTVHPNSSTVHPNATTSVHPNTTVPINSTVFPITSTVFPGNSTVMPHPGNSTVMPTATMHPSVMPSSSAVPPTTPPPPPQPKAKFDVKKNGTDCLLLWMSLRLTIKYHSRINGTMVTATLQMPANATATGNCGQDRSYINVEWPKDNPFYSVGMWFRAGAHLAEGATGLWQTENITTTVTFTNNTAFFFANETTLKGTAEGKTLEFLSGKLGHSLNCTQEEKVTLGSFIQAEFSNVRVQPFEVNHNFSPSVDTCAASPSPTPTTTATPLPAKKGDNHTVGIAIGVTVAVLVVVAVIAFVIIRRRKYAGAKYRKL